MPRSSLRRNLSRDRPTIGSDQNQSVLPNSSDNCENERTKVLYMKVKTTFSLKVESIMGLIGVLDRIGLSHAEGV